ncbi:MAG: tRNA pseudouridine(13) synthase TruD [archaeon]
MNFAKSPGSFEVKEILVPVFDGGKYFYYSMKKISIDTLSAANSIEKENNARVYFSGLKDSTASTVQWICAEKKLATPADARISLEFFGKSSKKIFAGMHSANYFKIRLTDVGIKEKKFLSKQLKKSVFPNYFDDQRFNDKTTALGKALLEKNFESAAKIALTKKLAFESEKSMQIKKLISDNWGNWETLLAKDTIPEIKKKIFALLKQENDFEKAVLLLEPKSVSLACRAIQSAQFNESLKAEIGKQKNRGQKSIEIFSSNFPINFSPKGIKRQLEIPPVFPQKNSLERKTFFNAKNIKTAFNASNCTLEFELKKGSYATILVKCIKELAGK